VKVNSISGVSCIVKDLDKTAEFYQALGFRLGNREPDHVTCYVNWFWVTFLAQNKQEDQERKKEAKVSNKGAGQSLYIKVDDINECYDAVIAHGMKPSSEPHKVASGNREFGLRDPDGYKLVLFAKK